MKRRTFMASSAGLLGGQLIFSATVNAQSGKPVSVARTSRLFERVPARPKEFIQDLLVWNDVLYCLHADVPTGYWGITATNTEGERLSHRDLPRGIYLKLGIQSEALLVHALTYYDLADHANPNCVLRLERNGSIRVLASMGTDFKGTLHFAGDSFFLGVRDAGAVEVWRGDDSVMSRIGTSKIPGPLGSAHFDLLSPNLYGAHAARCQLDDDR